jgi:hypothetical protein
VEYSAILSKCQGFLNEMTCLIFLGERLGVVFDHSTKSHPELAGEGIEYTWGKAKGVYRNARLADKKGKDNFRKLVSHCLSTQKGAGGGELSKEMIHKFSRQARHYILAFYYIEHEQESSITKEMSEINIKRVKKQFKTHWSAIDFDEKFINHCFQTTASAVNSGKPEQPKSTV